ncbi:MAG TPA: GNAT family N-acetyltransferase [Ilumatobacteraceae bacterium]|nr:GNAT family N-acetyltransferase [Ilumatobacteraceae bacterium]
MTVRPATAADLGEVVACVNAAYDKYVPRIGRKPAPMLADYPTLLGNGCVHVAVTEKGIVGIIVMWAEDDHWYIDNIAVRPDVQGEGVGKTLLDAAEAAARRNGCGELRLYTNEAMTDNLDYYPRRGFIETHRSSESGYRRVYYSKVLAQEARGD